MNEHYERKFFNKPKLLIRIKSMFIDTMVIILMMILFTEILEFFHVESGKVRAIFLIPILFYEPISICLGGTIGQRIMKIEVIKFDEFKNQNQKKHISFLFSLIRYITKIVLGWISLLTIHSDYYGQAIHDKVGKSIVSFR